MTVQDLGAIAGIVLSLAIAYIPGIRGWYEALTSEKKAQVMGALLVGSAVGVFLAACAGLYALVPCTTEGAKEMVSILIAALVANQATYLIAVRPFQKETR